MRRVLIYAIFVCVLGLAVDAANADLVARWKLDEGSGTTAADATGNGHNGTLLNGPQWVDGHFGKALKFAGSPQKVDVPFSAKLNPADEFSVSVWANVSPAGSSHRSPVTSRDDAPTRGYIIYVEPGNTWQFWMGTGVAGQWDVTQGPAARMDEWTYVTATYSNGAKKFYINGALVGQGTRAIGPNTQQVLRIGGGATEGTGNYFFVGMVDDVRIYNHALSDLQIQAVMADQPYPYPGGPKPLDGAMLDSTAVTLQWIPGDLAVSHNVYLGEDKDAVANATEADAGLFLGSTANKSFQVGSAGAPYPQGLTPGKTYYWRVDEVNSANPASPWKGEVWSFWVRPATAWTPSPADQGRYVDPDGDLSWQKGMGVLYHTVYIGESFDQISSATTGGMPTADGTFDPGPMKLGTTYYWRVDEFSMTSGMIKGDVWSFTTLPVIPIVDPNLVAWWTLDEGTGTRVVDWSGYGHHGTVVGAQWVDGLSGAALSFDGTDDYVNLGTPPDLYQPRNYTYCAWFRVARNIHGNSGTGYLLCVGSRSDLIFGVEDAVGVDGDLMLHYYDTVPGFHAVGAGQSDWLSDGWHMVAGTKDAAGGHKIYVDGVLKNSDTNTNNDNYAVTRMISLGARAWTGHQYYRGAIDEVRIYNKALTEQEIQEVMAPDPLRASDPVPALDSIADVRDASSLEWTAGATAVSHDVYFSTDRASVAGTGKDSPAYKGNQAATSFSLAGLVDLTGADYYWRIDEVQADGTIVTGQLWKFTVPPYLIVDDFESYTDSSPHRVFQTWIDGYGFSPDEFFPQGGPGNGTTAMVGYDPTISRVMETTIAVSGQSVPIDYNNINEPYYAEAQRTWSTPQDWTVEGVTDLSLQIRGYPVGFLETSPGNITMSASGADIVNLTDEFRYAYKKLSGDGSLTVRVESLVNTATWAKAGVIIRSGLEPAGQQVHMIITPVNRVEFMSRKAAGMNTTSFATNAGDNPMPHWIRLTRKGNTFTGEYSADSVTWKKITATDGTVQSVTDVPMIGDVYIGLAVTATNRNAITTAVFSNVQVTGATGGWSVAEIGYDHPSNDPAILYVALQDSAGKTAVVSYDDTSAVLSTDWLEWKIPLTRFSTISLKAVKKMSIGVGNRDAPAAGGVGRVFIDDIRVVKPEVQTQVTP